MSDELQMPEVPEPKPEDPEDVSWALSTAEAMWARGDHSEGVKWVRRAAEAASDAENDERSLELAKAAADLAQLVTRRASRASIHIDDSELAEEPAAKAPPPVPPKAPTRPPPPKTAPAAPRPVGASASITKQVNTPSRPPAPLPSSASRPPPAMGAMSAPKVPSINAKPLGTNTKSVPPPKAAPSDKAVDKKGARKSKTSLEAEAKAAGVLSSSVAPDTSPNPGAVAAIDETQETPMMRRSRPELGPSDPTIVGNINDLLKKKALASFDDDVEKTTDEWDAAATQNLTGEELNNLPFPGGPPPSSSPDSRKTSITLGTPDFKSTVQQLPKPSKTSAVPSSARATELHDPGIVTTQAVRVVVWRDGNGVHVAPAGTHVSAITVDAVLVALDGNADLTAWLTQKGR